MALIIVTVKTVKKFRKNKSAKGGVTERIINRPVKKIHHVESV